MIYLFDKDEKLIKIIRKPAIKTALQKYSLTKERYVSDRLTVEMKSLNDDELEKVEYMAIQTMEDAHTFHYFYVAQKSSENLTTLIGVQSGIEELRKSPVFDKRPKNALAREVINDLLSGTNWQARFVGETTPHSTNFYYISVFDALKKVCEVWDLEMQFFIEMNGNRIGARYIDFKRKIGQAVGKRVVYGHNALQILQEVERTNIFTALIGRGKGEQVSSAEDSGKQANGFGRKITFEDVAWSTASGKPVNKPKGQKYVELPVMTKLYGIKNADGSMRPKIGFVDFTEEESTEQLLERTYKALVDAARPQLTLKTSSVYLRGVKIGDTIRVVRHDKKLDYDTRIFEITFNRLNDQSSDIKLGDRVGESNEAKAQTIAEKAIDEFVSNEFSDFVQKLPDFLPSADGFNNNWYGAEDPTVKHPGKVLINDIWFKPDPEHEGHKIMLRWTGEVWDEILRSYDKESLKKRISEEIANFDKAFQLVNKQNKKKIDEILQSSGASSLLAQEAKRIALDSTAKLEEFKRQTTSAQTALSGDLDVLKKTLANDIRPKQEQVTVEIEKQVKALIQTKNELAGVKSAQATYEETTTRRLSELTNLANGKASKSELIQTAEELASKISSVRVGGTNLYALSKNKDILRSSHLTDLKFDISSGEISFKATGLDPYFGEATVHPKSVSDRNGVRIPVIFGKAIYVTVSNPIFIKNYISYFDEHGNTVKSYKFYKSSSFVIFPKELEGANFITMRFGCGGSDFEIGSVIKTKIKVEYGTIPTDWSPAPEDIEGQISTVESNFRQRADALDAGVSRLTEGLRSKADISSLNVTAENIRQSVKSLETNTQDKLNQMLSLAEFEVRAGSIRQEILNATKDKADKTLVTAEAGKLREEFSKIQVGGTNLLAYANFNFGGYYQHILKRDQNYVYSNLVEVTNTDYILQIWELEPQNKKIWAGLQFFDEQRQPLENGYSTFWFSDYLKKIIKLPENAKYIAISLEKILLEKEIAKFKLEIGNVATGWSPAPEDVDGLITEAKATFERTAQGLRTDLSAIQSYVDQDGQRQEELKSYARNESITRINIYRQDVARNYILRSRYDEDAKSIRQQFEAITNSQNGLIATKIADYKHSIDGKFTDISSQITTYKQDVGGQISGLSNRLTSSEQGTTTQISNLKTQVSANKANADSQFSNVTNQLARKVEITDFQRVRETSQLYERILGNTENGIVNNVARMTLTSQMFQVEVGKAFANHQNLFLSSTATKGFLGNAGVINVANNTQKEITSDFISVEPNSKIIFQHWVTLPENGMAWTAWQFFDKNKNSIDIRRTGLNAYKTTTGKQHNINQIIVPANAYFIRVSARMYNDGLIKIEHGSVPSDYSVAPNDALEAVKTVQSQLAGSWAVQNLTSAGSIVSQINATNNQILIEAEKIRLKGKTLLDELTAIQGYFKRLFVGDANVGTLNSDIIRANSITADKLVMDMAMARRFVSSDIFTDTLAAKEAFINKLRSVVVTATLLEGYRGRIGGFQIGTHDNDLSSFWLTGLDQFKVGMSNGRGREFQTAFWANWGNTWGRPGPLSWYVTLDGQMYCNNNATFHRVVDFSSTCSANFYGANSFYKDIYMRNSSEIYGTGSTPRAGGKNSVVWWNQVGDGSLKYHIDKASDKRLKENIVDSNIVALDKIKQLKMKSFDFISTGKHEEVGLIAQEVEAVLPSVISKNPEKADDYLHIDYVAIVPYLIKSIQELNQKIEEMEKIVA